MIPPEDKDLRSLFESRNGLDQFPEPEASISITGSNSIPFEITTPSARIKRSLVWKALWFGLCVLKESDTPPSSVDPAARSVGQFLEWLAGLPANEIDHPHLLGKFARHELESRISTTHRTSKIVCLLNKCLYDAPHRLSKQETHEVMTLVKNASLVRGQGSSGSVCDWFLEIDWLRAAMEQRDLEKMYLKLESPRIVSESLKICYATCLREIQNFRRSCLAIKSPIDQEFQDDFAGASWGTGRSGARWLISEQLEWFSPILHELGESDPGVEFFFTTRFAFNATAVQRHVFRLGRKVPLRVRLPDGREVHAQSPNVFGRCHLHFPCALEQLLVAQLLALLSVQPEQAGAMKLNNILIARNSRGRPVQLQVKYRKRRSRMLTRETPIVDARSPLGQALTTYFDEIDRAQPRIPKEYREFVTPHYRNGRVSPTLGLPKHGSSASCPTLLANWLNQPEMQRAVRAEYARHRVSRVFLQAFLTLMFDSDASYHHVRFPRAEQDTRIFERVLPKSMWSVMSVKQLGVYARSDQYRVGDLINLNSHSAETERLHYLNEKNKDWVNRYGRITRIVIDDLHNNAFRPNLARIKRNVLDDALRTEIASLSDITISDRDVLINDVNPFDLTYRTTRNTDDDDCIVVLDHPTTVVYMLHYLAQSEKYSSQLSRSCPEFLELTVASRCEWIELVMTEKLSPSVVERGTTAYLAVRDTLPDLFTSELRR